MRSGTPSAPVATSALNPQSPPGIRFVPQMMRIALILFTVSLFFNNFPIGAIPLLKNMTSIMGNLVSIVFVFYYYDDIRIPSLPARLFVLFGFLTTAFLGYYYATAVMYSSLEQAAFRQALLYAIMLLILAAVLRDPIFNIKLFRVIMMVIIVFGAIVVFELPFLLHTGGGGRFGIEGTNVNNLARLACYVLSWVMVSYFYSGAYVKKKKWLYLAAAFMMMMVIVKTASRGGYITAVTILTLSVFVSFGVRKIWVYFVAIPALAIVLYFSFTSNPVLVSRFEETIKEENYGERDVLLEHGWEYYKTSPWIGVGSKYLVYLGSYYGGGRRGTHNLYLQALLTSGAMGSAVLFTGMILLIIKLLRYRQYFWGRVFFLVQVTSMISGLAANMLYDKLLWMLILMACNIEYFVYVEKLMEKKQILAAQNRPVE